MNIAELMSINTNDLTEKQYNGLKKRVIYKQHDSLKRYVIEKMELIIFLLKKEKYDLIEKFLQVSEEGDIFGDRNHYIDFGYNDESMDIEMILQELKDLKSKLNKNDLLHKD